jgi:uncharacterized lipoprotein YddW (UPF0748 family)
MTISIRGASSRLLPWTLAALVFVSLLQAGTWGVSAQAAPDEVRALWVLRTSLTSPQAVASLVRTARASGFNTLLVQVRARGDAMFDSAVEPRAPQLAAHPGFDPLAEVLAAGRAAGLRVHAWVSVNLVSSATELPAARDHLIYRHPEWLMLPRAIAEDAALENPASPAYVGALARWTRANTQEVEGLYLSPAQPAAAAHTVSAIAEIVSRYAVDGVHLDYLRYPGEVFDYSRNTIAEFRAEMRPRVGADERQRLDDRAVVDLFAWPDAYPEAWERFRRSRLTSLLMRLRTALKGMRPDLILSAAVGPDAAESQARRLQDWRTWLELGLLDVVCPMAYTQDGRTFAAQIAAARQIPGLHGLWAGIGAYRLAPAQTIENIAAARSLGVSGVALFSYDALATVPNQPNYLADVGRLAFGGSTSQTLTGSR